MDWSVAWAWMQANSAGVSALATAATAVIAIMALVSAAQDSRARSRPMVLAEFRRAVNSDSAIDLVVRNAGPSVARDLRVTFDPEPVLPSDSSRLVTPYLLQRYRTSIPSLSPGQELSNIWFSGRAVPGGGNELQNGEPTSDEVVVTVSYRGVRRRAYRETFPLHVDLVRMTTYSTSSTSLPGRLTTIDKSLKTMNDSFREVARAARWSRRDEIAAEEAELTERLERMRRSVGDEASNSTNGTSDS